MLLEWRVKVVVILLVRPVHACVPERLLKIRLSLGFGYEPARGRPHVRLRDVERSSD
jgi:hypothetical protein